MIKPKKVRSKKCKVCSADFVPFKMGQVCCGVSCAVQYARISVEKEKVKKQRARDKAERARIRAVKKSLKDRQEKLKRHSDWVKEAQKAVNAYIRMRDEGKPCISCGTPLLSEGFGGGFDAGHFRSRGSAAHLRFHTLNIHGQCKRCNRWLSGAYDQFRLGLIDRYGLALVERIESDNRPRHYSDDDLKRIVKIFKRKCKNGKKKA